MQETNQNKDKNSARKFEIAIIGSGFAGICMGIKLREAGITDFVILEKADEIGGTWRDNTYPGAACDVSSHLYSFSFELNPKWKRMFSGQQEIFEYLKHCIKKYDLLKHIRFNAAVMGGKYEEESGIWLVDIANQSPVECRFWINGMGPLNRAVTPDIPGKESFKGAAFHSSSWNHDVDLKDKKVAVVGTGASAIQIVPAIAPMAKQLHLFQRTPAWIMPKHDREMLLLEQVLFRKMPFIQRLYRNVIYGINELTAIAMVYKPRLIKFLEKFAIRNMRKQVKDPELRKKLEPKYSFGCKRVLLSNDYYPALTRDNVEVITDSIASIYENGLKTDKNESIDVDAIVYCTGFMASEYPKYFKVFGKNGLELGKYWQDGPEAYMGTTVNGFPNLYFIIGPNTGLGHNSMVFMIEAQVNYIMDAIKKARRKKVKAMEVKAEVQQKFNENIQTKLQSTIWNSGCMSWYMTSSGKNTSIWPGFTFEFWNKSKKIKDSDYLWEK